MQQQYPQIPQFVSTDQDVCGLMNMLRIAYGIKDNIYAKYIHGEINNPSIDRINFKTNQQMKDLRQTGYRFTERDIRMIKSRIICARTSSHPDWLGMANDYERLLNSNEQNLSMVNANHIKFC